MSNFESVYEVWVSECNGLFVSHPVIRDDNSYSRKLQTCASDVLISPARLASALYAAVLLVQLRTFLAIYKVGV